ncbi:hypothetical protein M0P65_00190 [Candidatus Gracilibacteria bacterium]|nr:hypothetical protein [Candidatus Gracilibacteria bacterium]
MIKNLGHHTYSGLNRAEAREYKDYLTLLKDGFLFNLKLDKIEIGGYSKRELLNALYKEFEIKEDKINTKLLEKIYYVFKKYINYSGVSKSIEEIFEQVIKESFSELGINKEVDTSLVLIFVELYKKSSFLTRLDLMSVKGIGKDELKEIIYEELGIQDNGENTEEKAINTINTIFSDTIAKMKENFKLKIPAGYNKKKWRSLDEFMDFVLSTSSKEREGYLRVIDCAILKTMSAYNEIFENPLVIELDKKLNQVIEKIKEIPGFEELEPKNIDGEINFRFIHPNGGTPNFTEGKISYRSKDDIKILLKLLYNRKYSKLDFFKDLLGFRVEVKNKKDGENAILLFKELFNDNAEIDDSGVLSEKFLKNCKKIYGLNKRNQKNKSGSENFIKASLCGTFRENFHNDENIPPAEIQVVLARNKNESGYSKHEIYDAKKYISAISRLFGYTTLEDIKVIIHHFGLKSGLKEKGILYHLIASKKGKPSFLMRAKIDGCGKCDYFLSRDIYSEKLEELYQGDVINYSSLGDADFEDIYRKYQGINV